MINIEKGNRQIAERLVIDKTCPSFSGILCGNSAGKVWIDNVENPHFALVYSAPVGGFSVLGKIQTDREYNLFIDFIQNKLFQQLKEVGETEFEFAADDSRLEERLLESFSKYEIIRDQEIAYIQKNREYITTDPIKNILFRQVDEECIEESFKNKEFMMSRILESWGSVKSYLDLGVAFIAVDGNQIVGVILGSSNYNDILPIDIETLEEYRQLGIASQLTKYFLNYCIQHNKEAYWNCTSSNNASQKLAEKAGLAYIGMNDYFYFRFCN